jgi:hypothetical protein
VQEAYYKIYVMQYLVYNYKFQDYAPTVGHFKRILYYGNVFYGLSCPLAHSSSTGVLQCGKIFLIQMQHSLIA